MQSDFVYFGTIIVFVWSMSLFGAYEYGRWVGYKRGIAARRKRTMHIANFVEHAESTGKVVS